LNYVHRGLKIYNDRQRPRSQRRDTSHFLSTPAKKIKTLTFWFEMGDISHSQPQLPMPFTSLISFVLGSGSDVLRDRGNPEKPDDSFNHSHILSALPILSVNNYQSFPLSFLNHSKVGFLTPLINLVQVFV